MHPELIYLDNHASTPCDPRVVEAMTPLFAERYANPGSTIHRPGQAAAAAVQEAREDVARLVGARASETVFTASATESNNLAILGLAFGSDGQRKRIVTTAIEHKSVLEPAQWLVRQGFDVQVIPVDRVGRLDLDALAAAVDDATLLVSVQAANSEVGTVQDLPAVAEIAHRRGAYLHSDAVQLVGRVGDLDGLDYVDLVTFSAHKLYGPKGAAALVLRGGAAAVPIQPLMFGGGQEQGLRPGTLNVPAIVGFGAACRIAIDEAGRDEVQSQSLRDAFERDLAHAVPSVVFNGCREHRLPGNSSVTIPGVDAEALVARMRHVAVTTGSACNSGALEPSPVLTAMGMSRERAYETFRVGIGRFTTAEHVKTAVARIEASIPD